MSFSKYFRKFFGLPDEESSKNKRHDDKPAPRNEFRNPIWGSGDDYEDDDDDELDMSIAPYGFSVFSNPVELHRMLEHNMKIFQKSMEKFQFEMSQVFDSFDIPSFNDDFIHGFRGIQGRMPDHHIEDMTPHPDEGSDSSSLRDRYLKPDKELSPKVKPGFSPPFDPNEKGDVDLDSRIGKNEVGKILDSMPSLRPRTNFTFQDSRTSVSIINGKVLQKSVKTDEQGRKVTTVTKRLGDQEHTVITTTDKDGSTTIKENFVNLDEGSLENFEKQWNGKSSPESRGTGGTPSGMWFPDFSVFFK